MQEKKPLTPRYLATTLLVQLFSKKCPIKPLLDNLYDEQRLQDHDKRFTMQLIFGVLRQKQYLDRILELLSNTPIRKMDPFVHQTLAVALYQIFHLERIPESAAVNEAVKNCKTKKLPKRLHGFVNGILRQAIRQQQELISSASMTADGTTVLNHPAWLIKKWEKQFGESQTRSICLANSQEPQLTLRVNSSRIERQLFCGLLEEAGIKFHLGTYSDEAVVLTNPKNNLTAIPGFIEGYFQVQDEAAQLATSLLAPFVQGGSYLDGCAGLGGKTFHLLQVADDHKLKIQTVEPDRFRLTKFQENVHRLFPDINRDTLSMWHGNLENYAQETTKKFDGIFIDAPCSGTGVTGRHPDIRWNRSYEDLLSNQKLQVELLAQAATLVKSGGILVYATCSLEHEENHDVIATFLASHPQFTVSDSAPYLPVKARALVRDNFFCPRPDEGLDGFFGARLVRS